MTTLVLGANGSGKSAYAESLAARLRDSRNVRPYDGRTAYLYYIATMVPYGEEGSARVEKHRRQRASAGFITVERPVGVAGVPLPPDAVVLLEDVSNLLGNALFGAEPSATADGASTVADGSRRTADGQSAIADCGDSVFCDITALCEKCADAVLVSIDGLDASGPDYDDETRGYIGALNRLNARLAGFADAVVTMRAGKPEYIKCSDQWTVASDQWTVDRDPGKSIFRD